MTISILIAHSASIAKFAFKMWYESGWYYGNQNWIPVSLFYSSSPSSLHHIDQQINNILFGQISIAATSSPPKLFTTNGNSVFATSRHRHYRQFQYFSQRMCEAIILIDNKNIVHSLVLNVMVNRPRHRTSIFVSLRNTTKSSKKRQQKVIWTKIFYF